MLRREFRVRLMQREAVAGVAAEEPYRLVSVSPKRF
jgi:hypothetical protein